MRWERKCGQACVWLWSSWGKSERGAGGWLGMAWDGFFNMMLVFGGLSSGQSVPGEELRKIWSVCVFECVYICMVCVCACVQRRELRN